MPSFPSITMASWIKGGGFLGISLMSFRHNDRFRLDSAISTESRSYGTQFTHRFCVYEKHDLENFFASTEFQNKVVSSLAKFEVSVFSSDQQIGTHCLVIKMFVEIKRCKQ